MHDGLDTIFYQTFKYPLAVSRQEEDLQGTLIHLLGK